MIEEFKYLNNIEIRKHNSTFTNIQTLLEVS